MPDHARAVTRQYSQPDLAQRLLAALEAAGKDVNALQRRDLAAFDAFHVRGLDATRELLGLADLPEDARVLDVGCGLGGPARTLAAEAGCVVVGVDLVAEHVRAARELTARVGLADRVAFRQADALALPFDDGSFDAVWLQHATMNVPDKAALFRQARRVLAPGGRVALHEVLAGAGGSALFPAPWADGPDVSFLATAGQLREALEDAGFREAAWRDVTKSSLEWFRGVADAVTSRAPDAPPSLGLNLLMGGSTLAKVKNQVRNLEEGRIRVVQAVFHVPQ